ncbi:MAG: putative Ig domain-containing protein [Holophagaceae bacterium]|nr:putative Ig domain-containing protein [Holophagaceae bacterium]
MLQTSKVPVVPGPHIRPLYAGMPDFCHHRGHSLIRSLSFFCASILMGFALFLQTGCSGGGGGGGNPVQIQPPSTLTYSSAAAVYTKGTAIAANTPSSGGGAVVSYSVSPALPAGLGLSTGTGVISGTPTAITAAASYTITATNSGGSTTASVSITVNDAAPSGLAYTYTPARFTTGNAIPSDSPSSGGGPVVSYAVSPALPAGLLLNSGTGVITGTPTAITAQATYTVTATNSGGSASVGLDFTVVPPGPSITSQPADASSLVGGTASFSVTVSGSGPFTYQWQKNDANIPNATSSSYTTPILALGDSGTRFRALVFDAYASQDTSHEATLTVVGPVVTAIAITPSAPTVTAGATLALTATGTYSDGTTANVTNSATWSSSNTAVAIIGSTTGIATGITVGTSTIFASLGAVTSPGITLTVQGGCVPPPSGMVAWYPGDGNADDILGGTGTNGTLKNGATFTPGMVGQAFHFDGVNDHVSIDTTGFVKGQSAATVDAWVRPLGPHSNGFGFGGAVFNESTSAPSGDYTRFGIFVRNDGSVLFGGRSLFNGETGSFVGVATSAGVVPLNQWSHIAGTWSSTQGLSIYINGQLAASLNLMVGAFADTNSEFVAIGTDAPTAGTAAQFNGDVDEVEVFTRVLSQTEIQSIVDAGSAGKCKPGAPGDPGLFTATGNLLTGRHSHTSTLLTNGKVLITGGLIGSTGIANAELYDPATGIFTATGNLITARYGHTSTLLPNGKVLVAAGYRLGFLASTELYDPATGTFTATGSLIAARTSHTATLLPTGKVLIAGGAIGSGPLASGELYDPATGISTATGNLITARQLHTATLLPNGKVLIAGGIGASGYLVSAELYDPATGVFTTTGSLITARSSHKTTLLANGKVLITGGVIPSGNLASVELYDPATGTFTATGSLITMRQFHTATLLPNGKVLIASGVIDSSNLASAELYDPATGLFTATGSLITARSSHTATLLHNGKVLIAGGVNASVDLASAELY